MKIIKNVASIFVLTSMLAFALPSMAVNYSMRQAVEGVKPISSSSSGNSGTGSSSSAPSNQWVTAEPLYGLWESSEDQTGLVCSDWMPLASEINKNESFLQSQSCEERQQRNVSNREYNSFINEYRVVNTTIEDRVLNTDKSQVAIGTKLVLTCKYEVLVNYVNRTRGGIGTNKWALDGVVIGSTTETEIEYNGIKYYQGAEIEPKRHEICWESI